MAGVGHDIKIYVKELKDHSPYRSSNVKQDNGIDGRMVSIDALA